MSRFDAPVVLFREQCVLFVCKFWIHVAGLWPCSKPLGRRGSQKLVYFLQQRGPFKNYKLLLITFGNQVNQFPWRHSALMLTGRCLSAGVMRKFVGIQNYLRAWRHQTAPLRNWPTQWVSWPHGGAAGVDLGGGRWAMDSKRWQTPQAAARCFSFSAAVGFQRFKLNHKRKKEILRSSGTAVLELLGSGWFSRKNQFNCVIWI